MSRGNRKAEMSKQRQQGKLTPSQLYSSSSQSSLCHLVTPPLLRASCPGIQQLLPKSSGVQLLVLCPDLLQEGQGCTHLVPSMCQNFSKPRPGRRALSGRDTPKDQDRTTALCLPPVSCPLCMAFVSLFVTKLESWLQGPWLCWGRHTVPWH